MPRFAVDPQATQGVKMPDGTVYLPSRSGSIDVSDKKHIAQLRGKNSAKNLDLIIEAKGMPKVADGKNCPRCLFHAWAFTKQCPRCKTMLD